MGLWLKQEDGTLVEVSGGGGGGSFDGEHVLTGDPSDPAVVELVDEGQLLYDGVEGDGSGGGPHDHDYLPLTGGTLTGGLTVNGNSDLKINPFADAWGVASGTVFAPQGLVGGTQGSYGTAMTSNGYRNTGAKWTSLGLNNEVGATTIELRPDGKFYVRVASNFPTGSASAPPIQFSVNETTTTVWNTFNPAGGTTFGITEGIDTRDVLERAETATMPALDDEGVATADVDGLTVNEVVTALLAKVKELSAEIETLKGT